MTYSGLDIFDLYSIIHLFYLLLENYKIKFSEELTVERLVTMAPKG